MGRAVEIAEVTKLKWKMMARGEGLKSQQAQYMKLNLKKRERPSKHPISDAEEETTTEAQYTSYILVGMLD